LEAHAVYGKARLRGAARVIPLHRTIISGETSGAKAARRLRVESCLVLKAVALNFGWCVAFVVAYEVAFIAGSWSGWPFRSLEQGLLYGLRETATIFPAILGIAAAGGLLLSAFERFGARISSGFNRYGVAVIVLIGIASYLQGALYLKAYGRLPL
jgi:hypothetical protein